jgi:type II secretory pathway component PulL
VLQTGHDGRHLWQFATGNGEVALNTEQRLAPDAPLPSKLVGKDWRALWQKKLNVAWLPAEQVFLRVVHLPKCDHAELLSMVELQLEKLSPLPVNQIVWSVEPLPHPTDSLQTVIVIVAERSLVEDYLGTLESSGYLPDRLELPLLHQLLVTNIDGDGAWIYLHPAETKTIGLVAWWTGGALQQLNLLHLANGESGAAALVTQLNNIVWAGELEGWLASPPRWRLVADRQTASVWEPALRQWSGETVETLDPISPSALASLAARRAARAETKINLLPTEFSVRYQQQFVDRLWMRGLGALAVIYIFVVAIYFGAVQVLKFQRTRVEKQMVSLSGAYTNALQLKERLRILNEQVNLKYAALDCWKAASELLPPELTLASFSFSKGNKLTLRGTSEPDQQSKVTDYNTAMSKAMLDGKLLFKKVNPANYEIQSWFFDCDLHQSGTE